MPFLNSSSEYASKWKKSNGSLTPKVLKFSVGLSMVETLTEMIQGLKYPLVTNHGFRIINNNNNNKRIMWNPWKRMNWMFGNGSRRFRGKWEWEGATLLSRRCLIWNSISADPRSLIRKFLLLIKRLGYPGWWPSLKESKNSLQTNIDKS